jgi:hypothetical protein
MTDRPQPHRVMTSDPRCLAQPGDWLEARGVQGRPGRRGQIVEVFGTAGHRRYRVRWDEEHESIVFPADGVSVLQM